MSSYFIWDPSLGSNFKCLLKTRAGRLFSVGCRYILHAEMTCKCRCTILLMLLYRKVEMSVQQSKTQSARNNHTKSQQDTRNKTQLRCDYGHKFSTAHLPLNSWGWGEDSVFRRTAEVSHSSNWSVILSARLVQLNPQPKSCQGHKHTHTHCKSRHILRNVAIFSPTRAWVNNLQSVISQYSSSLNKRIPNPAIWVNPVIPSKSFVMQGQTNSCLLVNKAQITGWALFYECTNSRWKGHIERKMDFT